MLSAFRHTKIVFTIGPATSSPEMLELLIGMGANVCRLNMAHASAEWTRQTVAAVREAGRKCGRELAIMMDIKGPEIRTGDVAEPIDLQQGELFDFYVLPERISEADKQGVRGVTVNYPGLAADVREGNTLLVDSGLIRMRVHQVRPERVRCEVRIAGKMGSRRHINLPGIKVNLPCLTQKDKTDVDVGVELGVEFFALSFVREPDDLDVLRRYLSSKSSEAKIIAKIEDQSAITNLDDIITASDGLMVARGDLGIEIPYETLPIVQRRAVKTCLRMGKPVIIATHMLESMITQPMPTRAEISDVSNAVLEQADCVMLSGETTVGKYPLECVDVLNRVITAMEQQNTQPYNTEVRLKTPKALLLRSAALLADEIENAAILAFTRSGYIAQVLSSLRPRRSAIYAFTDVPRVYKQAQILWGVLPFHMEFCDDPEQTIQNAIALLRDQNHVRPGTRLIVISYTVTGDRVVDTIQLRSVE